MAADVFVTNADRIIEDLLAGRLILRRCRPEHRATLIAILNTIASTALHDLIGADVIERDGDLLAQVDGGARFVELPTPTGRPS